MISDRTVLLFFEPPSYDRLLPHDRHVRKLLRPIYNRVRRGQIVSGFQVVHENLAKALEQLGYRVEINRRDLARRHPEHPVAIIGYRHLLDSWDLPNPAILGPGLYDHPAERPELMRDPRFHRYLVHSAWVRDLFAPWYGDKCVIWYAGVDADAWTDAPRETKDLDFVIYDKISFERDRVVRETLQPILRELDRRGLSHKTLRYGKYQHSDLHRMLARAKGFLFLSHHETQGLACQQALLAGVPVLAWDFGWWQDPKRFIFNTPNVQATSVPYFSAECGETFTDAAGFPAAVERFLARRQDYAGRDYVMRELSLESSARLFLSHYDSLRSPSLSLTRLGQNPG